MIDTTAQQMGTEQLLLATKLYVPRARSTLLSRPRLLARLDAGLQSPLTLISAPTGSGKTALLSDWLNKGVGGQGLGVGDSVLGTRPERTDAAERSHPRPLAPDPRSVAWLSLDAGDDDLLPFLRYLVAACQSLMPSAGSSVVPLLQGRASVPSLAGVMTPLLNDLSRVPVESVLVLDDYHVVTDARIHEAVAFLIDHLPPSLHVVITSRSDPTLPLARWRAHGMLCELRAADLRFTVEEASAFLTQVMRLPLSTDDVQALEQRTEGWVAGLQFAALAMRDRADLQGFVNAFTGSHRFVVDFLVDEVLLQQPPHLQSFLLRTSILHRMCGSLCDAVMGVGGWGLGVGDGDFGTPAERSVASSHVVPQPPTPNPRPPTPALSAYSQLLLEELEHANLFVVPLDDVGSWYRYHQLFADVLRHRLHTGVPADEVRALHARAAAWHEQHGAIDEAVRHALAGDDITYAARLIEQQALARLVRGELATVQAWLDQLPEELVRARPFLGRALVLLLLLSGRFRELEAPLAALERALTEVTDRSNAGMLQPDDARLRVLAGEVAASRAFFANLREQTDIADALCREALTMLPPDHVLIGFAHFCQGVSAWLNGNAATAVQLLQQARQECQAAGNTYMLQVSMAYLAQARQLQGSLQDAVAIYRQALEHTPTIGGNLHPQGNGLCVGLGALQYERNKLAAAERSLTTGIELARQDGNLLVLGGGLLMLARVRQAQGNANAARSLLEEASQLLSQHGITWLWVSGSVVADSVRVAVQIDDLDRVAAWVTEPPLADRPDYLAECDDLARARALLAMGRTEEAQSLLEARLPAAECAGRTGHVVEGLALLALAHWAQGRHTDALSLIERALRLAAPEGYVRTFVDMGGPIQALLRAVPARDDLQAYLRRLLAAFSHGQQATAGTLDKPLADVTASLAEPLTARECEVLRLIAAGKTNGEIAAQLVVAVSTVKAHINNIFGKLGVASRTQALARASDLQIL